MYPDLSAAASNQFWFSRKHDEGKDEDQSIKIRFNDGGHGQISGSVRWYMPIDNPAILKLHTDFGSQIAIEQQLIRQVVTKSVYMTGPLMSSKESSAEKRNDLLVSSFGDEERIKKQMSDPDWLDNYQA